MAFYLTRLPTLSLRRSIFADAARDRRLDVDFRCAEAASFALERESRMRNFGNADAARKFAERLDKFVSARARAAAPPAVAGKIDGAGGAAASIPAAAVESVARAADVAAMLAAERPPQVPYDSRGCGIRP